MKITCYTLLITVSLLLNVSCVASYISMTGKKHPWGKKNITRQFFVENYGPPIVRRDIGASDPIALTFRLENTENSEQRAECIRYSKTRESEDVLNRRYPMVKSYEIFHYCGLMQDPEAASAAATTNAISLGAGEAISIPFSLIRRVTGSCMDHYFVVSYDAEGKICGWKEIQASDFKPEVP